MKPLCESSRSWPAMTRNRKFGVGALLLVGAIGYLVYAGVQQGSVYYFTVDEFLAKKDAMADQGIRVAGRVAQGSVRKEPTNKGVELQFTIGDFVANGGAEPAELLPVHFSGVLPDMFGEGRDVIVEGKYLDGVLEAQTVMTSCPSKYEPGKDGAEKAERAS